MSETPERETDPLELRVQALSALEKAHTSRFHGRVQKVSVSMPEELTAAIRERSGPGGFSRFVSEAAERRLKDELLRELLDEMDAEFGPVSAQELEEALREWPDYEE